MQRSIMSFFYPTKEGKTKKPEKETSHSGREAEPPPKVALKERNGVVAGSDSPVKRPGRKVARVLSSEGEEEDEALSPPRSQKSGPERPQDSPPSPAASPENTPCPSDSSPVGLATAGIPKRLTARKQLPKRTIQDVLGGQDEDKDREAKRKKKEEETETPRESPTEAEVAEKKDAEEGPRPMTPPEPPESPKEAPVGSSSEPQVAVKQEPQEDQAKPLPAPPGHSAVSSLPGSRPSKQK